MYSITLTDWPTAEQTLRKLEAWIKPRTLAGKPVTLAVTEDKRSLLQNDHIHPVVRRICREIGRTDEETVRALLVEQWRHETRKTKQYMPSIDGLRMIEISNSTRAMDKPTCSEFLDWLIAFEASVEKTHAQADDAGA